MTKKARVVIELEEHFEDDVDDDMFDEYDDVDDIGDFAELVWKKRLEEIGMDGGIVSLDCHRVDD